LSFDTKVNGIALKDYWLGQVQEAIVEMAAGDWVLDCRSEGYRALAPIPASVPTAYLDVVSANGGKALNHFNKIHKGELVRALVNDSPSIPNADALADWATVNGFAIELNDTAIQLTI
jgi:cytoplasmic iron level regulating protein YaaA (DUF328/UPF0246 family)